MNASAVDAVALRECRAEIRKLRADLRAILPLAENYADGAQELTSVEGRSAALLCQRARKALNRRSP